MIMRAVGKYTGRETKNKKDGGHFQIIRFIDDMGKMVEFFTSDLNLGLNLERLKDYELELDYSVNGNFKNFDILNITPIADGKVKVS